MVLLLFGRVFFGWSLMLRSPFENIAPLGAIFSHYHIHQGWLVGSLERSSSYQPPLMDACVREYSTRARVSGANSGRDRCRRGISVWPN